MWSVQKVFPQAKNINCVLDMYVVCDIEFKFRRFFPNKVKFYKPEMVHMQQSFDNDLGLQQMNI